MQVEFNPSKVSMSGFAPQAQYNAPSFTSAGSQMSAPTMDEFVSSEAKEAKGVKEGVAGTWKFFAKFNAMTGATLKGLFYGALTGFGLLGGSWLVKTLPSAFKKEGPKLLDVLKNPIKTAPKGGKILAAVAAATVLTVNLVKGVFASNQKTAVIDHKMKTGHRDK